ncbi:type I-E CRISPR-associated protein Cas5/CasD [Streptomyces buecherae]|uniref:type I-E CRISPR-associated protein Cas5/CasD n=1 Tax=Streptomyces buecherae TaxID=2763006 RepID=UPI00367C1620
MSAPTSTPEPIPGLLLRLAGPLQSWGEHSHFNDRDTLPFPTRSAVTGLLAAALGRPREHPLDDLADISVTVRVDRPGVRLRDFHTVGGGLTGQQTVVTADGGRRSGDTSTLTSTRWYLADATFTLALTRPDHAPPPPAWAQALREPHWPLYLGRRSCPPAGPLLLGHSTDALHDLVHLPLNQPRTAADTQILFLSDRPLTALASHHASANGDAGEEHSSVLDVPLAFTPHRRRYRARPLYRRTLTRPGTQCTGYGIAHLTTLAAYTSATYTPAHHPQVRQGSVT